MLTKRSSLPQAAASLAPLDDDALTAAARDTMALLPHEPRLAEVQARMLHARTQQASAPHAQFECALTHMRVCNFLGHFGESIALYRSLVVPESSQRQVYLEMARALGHFNQLHEAQAMLALAQAIPNSDPIQAARECYVSSQLLVLQNHYRAAYDEAQRAHEQFVAAGHMLEAGRCLRQAAYSILYLDPQQSLPLLAQARDIFAAHGAPLDVAYNNYILAVANHLLNQFNAALELHQQCAQTFDDQGSVYFAALSHDGMGVALCRLTRFTEAEPWLLAARDSFRTQDNSSEATRCEINLAWLYRETRRPALTVPLLQHALDDSLQQGRMVRAARCIGSLSGAYRELGQYDKALSAMQRARDVFAQQQIEHTLADLDEDLAKIYLPLSLLTDAREADERALRYYRDKQLHVADARTQIHLAEVHLLQNDLALARTLLEQARSVCEANQLSVLVGECERLLAELALREQRIPEAKQHLKQARERFAAESRDVSLAQCDLLEGELLLTAKRTSADAKLFARAQQVLAPALPELAWRALAGLAHCALQKRDRSEALRHFMQAINLIQRVRAPLPSERLSAAFFGARRGVHDEAFTLAVQAQEWEQALTISEAARASTFTRFLQNRQRLRSTNGASPHRHGLDEQAQAQRALIESLYAQLELSHDETKRPPQRELLQQLSDAQRAYEHTLEQVRIAASDASFPQSLATFSLSGFRRALSAHSGARWRCLAYHVVEHMIYIFDISADDLRCTQRTLSPVQWRRLEQCTSNVSDLRELIYRGTLGGAAMKDGHALRDAFDWLIPAEVGARLHELDLFVIIPAGLLHGLAFAALREEHGFLIERAPLLSAPSLLSLQLLVDARATHERATLLCGLDDFRGRAKPLPHAQSEIDGLATLCNMDARKLWGEAATLEALQQLNAAGTLQQMARLHFATHSIADAHSPRQSRILLHGRDLFLADVLDWQLHGALVTLSSCHSGGGSAGSGDELLNLARAFFYAGAHTLVASQWHFEDKETEWLMREYYARLVEGERPTRALQQAQVTLLRQGAPPFQWAAFSVMGRP